MKAKKIKTGSKKPTASRAVQCRMLGFSTPYEVTENTGSTVWVKNAFTCYNLESKNIMCRHDCFWNCSTPGALSDVIANTSNDTDLVTTSEEEFDYTLIRMDTQPRTTPSEWADTGGDPTQILREIGDPIPIEDKSHERPNEHERQDLLDHIASNQTRVSQNLTSGPKEIRPQVVYNNITPRDPLEISEHSNEK